MGSSTMSGKSCVVVGNIHVLFNPKHGDVKLGHNFKVHGSSFLVPLAGLLDGPLDTTQLTALIEKYVLDPSSDESFDRPAPEDGDSHPN